MSAKPSTLPVFAAQLVEAIGSGVPSLTQEQFFQIEAVVLHEMKRLETVVGPVLREASIFAETGEYNGLHRAVEKLEALR